ncbi:hypothetical protein U9M48_029023 [Paspalum notatum var. saurae]|uniref:3-ketoacyl-CoA synthase n=1 Tax=Paspalum notatum var. saurae TaxID=547442 RepID=A0AAQ3X2B6_PASNO
MNPSPIHKCLKIVYTKTPDNFLLALTIAAILVMARFKSDVFTDPVVQAFGHPRILTTGLFLVAISVIVHMLQRPRKVYLIDYACFRPTHHNRAPYATFVEHVRQISFFICSYINVYKYCTLEAGREEAQLVVFSAIDDLLAKTNIAPVTIDVLVVNCSGFSPTPSFPDMIVNKYKMLSDIHSVHLSGMGCSAGLISIELAKNLLQAMPHVLLSTSPTKARFRLKCLVRTLTGASDNSYKCIHQEEDDKGHTGINLSKDLMVVAGATLKANITTIAPLILPASEKLRFVLSFISRKLLRMKTKLYVPNFLAAVKHICIHAGGRAVIDEIQCSLGLSDEQVEPSRMTLHRFGNISSNSLWYEMAYIEAKLRMHRGDRLWMIGFGSGFKCNSAVWECINPAHIEDGPWASCIHRYPVHIP